MKGSELILIFLITFPIPYFHTHAYPFILDPKYIVIREFVSPTLSRSINAYSLGGSDTLNFVCDGPEVTPPPNGTSISTVQSTLTFSIDSTRAYKRLVTCYVYSSDSWNTVTFDIMIDRLTGGLSLSTDSLAITQETETKQTYQNKIYLSSEYNFSIATFKLDSPVPWFSANQVSVPPSSSIPLAFTVDTRGLPPGVYYTTAYYTYTLNNSVGGKGSIRVTLNVTAKQSAITTLSNYEVTLQTIDDADFSPVQASIFLSSSDSSLILFTDSSGTAKATLKGGSYSVSIRANGYEPLDASIFIDRNLSRVFKLKKSEEMQNNTNATTTTIPTGQGVIRIPSYNVTIKVARGTTNSASLPLIAVSGSVTLQVTPVTSQPEWISASLSSTQLLEGQTGFLVITASPTNTTTLGNHTKQFYLAYNNNVAVITANVQVVSERTNITYSIPIYNQSYQRPSYLKVPIVSVILRGTEGVSPTAPAKCKMNDVVYVTVQGDYNLVKVKAAGLALLGAEPRVDGIVYRYQVKENNAQLSIFLVYTNPVTGLEATEQPEEYGFGNYRFEVIENPEAITQKNAVLMVTIGEGTTLVDTSKLLTCQAYIYYPNGTKTAYEGTIDFQANYQFANISLTPSITFTAGFGTINFRYAGTYIPQKPSWWNGDFRVNPMQIEVKPTLIDYKDLRQWNTDDMITYDLTDFGVDPYRVDVTPRTQFKLQGTTLLIKPEADVSYTITIYGFLNRPFQSVVENRDVIIRITTMKVTTGSTQFAWSFILPAAIGLGAFFLIRFIYVNMSTRRARRPWEG